MVRPSTRSHGSGDLMDLMICLEISRSCSHLISTSLHLVKHALVHYVHCMHAMPTACTAAALHTVRKSSCIDVSTWVSTSPSRDLMISWSQDLMISRSQDLRIEWLVDLTDLRIWRDLSTCLQTESPQTRCRRLLQHPYHGQHPHHGYLHSLREWCYKDYLWTSYLRPSPGPDIETSGWSDV